MTNIAAVKYPESFFIGGSWTKPSTTSRFDVLSSSTEDLYVRIASAAPQDVDQAVAAARKAFDKGPWPRMRPQERARYLYAMAKEIKARSSEFARVWSTESGVTYQIAEPRIGPSMSATFEFYAGLADTFAFVEQRTTRNAGFGALLREPVGVVAAIVPWNAPAGLMTTKVAPALLAGCCVIVKASPEAPCSAYLMAEICESVGLPPGVFNILTADRDVSELLVRHSDVDKITFTGSTAAGRKIGALCGERVARCTLELGGKSAAVILDDADIGKAAAKIAGSAVYLTGQVCHSLTRIIVSQGRHDAMVDALSADMARVEVGDPFETSTGMGPLATERQRARVEEYIAKGRAEGAQLAVGGQRPLNMPRGFFIQPTVFGRVDNQAAIARDEIFGPILSVIAANDEQHAIDLANDSIYGLNASVFTDDPERAFAAARQLRCGTVSQNGAGIDFSIAFGGFKQSGVGREGGIEGLLPFCESKTLLLSDRPSTF